MFLAQQNLPTELTLEPLLQDQGIVLALMGMLVVFSALALVVAFISGLPRILNALLGPEDARELATSLNDQGGAEQNMLGDDLPEETLVIICAAVAAVMDKPHRVMRIRGVLPTDYEWSREGRMQQHFSHKIQHRARG